MKLAVVALLLAGVSAAAQQNVIPQADCTLAFSFTAAGNKQLADNTGTQCINWTIGYAAHGFSALTLSVQEAPDAGNTPGTWSDWGGTVVSGSQPNTAITQTSTQLSGYYRWVRVKLSGLTGSGTVTGVLYGTSNASGGGGSGPAGPSYYQTVQVGGSSQVQRAKLNLIAGANVTITPVDNSGANSTDVTISASGGGGGGGGPVACSITLNSGNSYSATCTHNLGNPQPPLACRDTTTNALTILGIVYTNNNNAQISGTGPGSYQCTAATGPPGPTCGTSQLNVASSRAYGTIYQNTSSCIMHVVISTLNAPGSGGNYDVYSDSSSSPSTVIVEISQVDTPFTLAIPIPFQVLPSNYYKVAAAAGSPGIDTWTETY